MTRRFEIGWGAALLAVAMLLGVVVAGQPESGVIDQWWHGVIADIRSPGLVSFGHVLDQAGGGPIGVFVVPLLIALLLLYLRGWRAGLFALAVFIFSALLVQVAKHLLGRARPEDLMVVSDYGSFPSGHTANAATIALVLWLLIPRVGVAIAGVIWVLLMAFARTMLSAHWLTDTLGGAMLGVGAALLMAAALLPWAKQDRQLEAPEEDPPRHALAQ